MPVLEDIAMLAKDFCHLLNKSNPPKVVESSCTASCKPLVYFPAENNKNCISVVLDLK